MATRHFFGWPDIPRVKAEVAAWYEATTLDEEKAIARRLNKAALENAISPLGAFLQYHGWRSNVTGVVTGAIALLLGRKQDCVSSGSLAGRSAESHSRRDEHVLRTFRSTPPDAWNSPWGYLCRGTGLQTPEPQLFGLVGYS